jgi:hypothetical protein
MVRTGFIEFRVIYKGRFSIVRTDKFIASYNIMIFVMICDDGGEI